MATVVRPAGETETFFAPKPEVDEARSTVRVELAKETPGGAVVALRTTEGAECVLVRSSDLAPT